VHLVGFIIRIFHDAQSPELQIQMASIVSQREIFSMNVFPRLGRGKRIRCRRKMEINLIINNNIEKL